MGGCLLFAGLLFWPLAILGVFLLLGAGLQALIGVFERKVTVMLSFCGACHRALPSPSVSVCHACRSPLSRTWARVFANATQAAAAREKFGVVR